MQYSDAVSWERHPHRSDRSLQDGRSTWWNDRGGVGFGWRLRIEEGAEEVRSDQVRILEESGDRVARGRCKVRMARRWNSILLLRHIRQVVS